MEKLETKLENFNPKSENDLKGEFDKLAEAFLYGGYVSVKDNSGRERYRIYLRTVEFYCHSEDNNSDLPKDPIVYHRNGRYIDGNVPYFPLLAFHAHASGIDIAFEKEELNLRASALIRAYEVYDVQRKIFLTYDRETKKFIECKDEKKRVNTQSTYLYNFLNGFIGDSVIWVDFPWSSTKDFKTDKRKNVFKYNENEEIIVDETGKKTKDSREWSYTRTEDLNAEQL